MAGRWAAVVVALWLVTGCATPVRQQPPAGSGGDKTEPFLLVRYGWHTGVVVEAAGLNRRLPELAQRFPRARHYEIGWGDAGFYQSAEVDSGLALRAMFHSRASVVHVVGFGDDLAAHLGRVEVRELAANRENHRRFLDYLESSFARGADGRVVAGASGLFGDSQFYEGAGRYHVCHTCNSWTAGALRSAGVDIGSGPKLTAGALLRAVAE
ncbi:MAG: DUF2459 domain-containing protein [Akkermansiaceae bacterium]|nr:DUF2459 domain-containing protein [Akkermansiaceae bacterium]